MVDIVIMRSNSIIKNPRVNKIAKSLGKLYSISVFGWNREGISKRLVENYFAELRLHNIRAPFGKSYLIAYFPLFWIWIFFNLVVIRPKVVHACDLDTIIPCYIYKLLFRKKLVFDVCDRYAMAKISQKSRLLYALVNDIEEFFCKRADVLITVSEKLLSTIQKKPDKFSIIMNCPESYQIEKLKSYNDVLTLVYTGNILRNRGLDRITAAIKDLDRITFVFAGRVVDQQVFNQISNLPNTRYKGILELTDALSLEANADVMIILYDLNHRINNFAMPNKIFEAMLFGLPIITNVATEIIEEVGCGITVNYDDLNQIKSAIISLRDDKELRRKLGENGRRAFEQKYNWQTVEQELFKIYERLLHEHVN